MPWNLNGNSIAANEFLGTTNSEPLVVKTNNTEALRVDTNGSVGIATSTPIAQLDVRASSGVGVRGEADSGGGIGVAGVSSKGVGVIAASDQNTGSIALSRDGIGAYAESRENEGVRGLSHSLHGGVVGLNDSPSSDAGFGTYDGAGVYGQSSAFGASGTFGSNRSGFGVTGIGIIGVRAVSQGVAGVSCEGNSYAIWARSSNLAGAFDGNVSIQGSGTPFTAALGVGGDVYISGKLSVVGHINKFGGGFRIDHPTDPANRYLNHSFVESPERKNVYDGIAVLNAQGEAEVKMPAWFDAVNHDFRYQLTAIGAPGPNLHIARGLVKNAFRIAGGKPGTKVSWQLTGIRKDPWARKNPMTVEEKKSGRERGRFLDPALYGQPKEKAIRQMERPEDPMELAKRIKPAKATGSHPGLLPANSRLSESPLHTPRPRRKSK
jgi:hypothetical protein